MKIKIRSMWYDKIGCCDIFKQYLEFDWIDFLCCTDRQEKDKLRISVFGFNIQHFNRTWRVFDYLSCFADYISFINHRNWRLILGLFSFHLSLWFYWYGKSKFRHLLFVSSILIRHMNLACDSTIYDSIMTSMLSLNDNVSTIYGTLSINILQQSAIH